MLNKMIEHPTLSLNERPRCLCPSTWEQVSGPNQRLNYCNAQIDHQLDNSLIDTCITQVDIQVAIMSLYI